MRMDLHVGSQVVCFFFFSQLLSCCLAACIRAIPPNLLLLLTIANKYLYEYPLTMIHCQNLYFGIDYYTLFFVVYDEPIFLKPMVLKQEIVREWN